MTRMLIVVVMTACTIVLNAQEYRSFNGSQNNINNPSWGAAGGPLQRVTEIGYEDGISSIGGTMRPNARTVSNTIFDQKEGIDDAMNLSDYSWVFGQFIDHDISLVDNNPFEEASISIPNGDKVFNENDKIGMLRSLALTGTGTSEANPRQYANSITSFIDGSGIYGSDEVRSNWLRTFKNGKLKTSKNNLLPWNTIDGEYNSYKSSNVPFMADDVHSGTKLFVAGDIRANENPLLTAFHTLFVREHNRMCNKLLSENPTWGDDKLYYEARKWISAYLQNIAFNEWLPSMGVHLPEYRGYNSEMNPSIMNVFSAAAFRMGHTLINSNIIRMNSGGKELPIGNISIRDAFFNPAAIILAGDIDPYLIGMATQVQQEMDCKVINDLRNFLFSVDGEKGLDLAAININRGRERGLPDFNTIRWDFGLPKNKTFVSITKDKQSANELKELYKDMSEIDPWVGMLAEYHMPNALFGETVMTIMERQFRMLRDGDRFYFENDLSFSDEDLEEVRKTTLREIVMRNTGIKLMQDEIFSAMPHEMIPNGPSLKKINLESAIYPNPTSDYFALKVFMVNEESVKIRVYDMSGSLAIFETKHLYSGENYLEFDVSNLKSGVYNVLVELGYAFKIERLIIE